MSEFVSRNAASPKRQLFKYLAINEHTLSLLSTGAVYFSSPADFNDPFDTRFVKRDLCAQQQQLERERRELGTDSAILGAAMMSVFEREHSECDVKPRIYCMSEIANSILMWSHYADSHRGICAVFEAEEMGEPWMLSFAGSSFSFAGMALTKFGVDGSIEVIDHEPSSAGLTVSLPANRVLYTDKPPGMFVFDPVSGGPMRGITYEFVKNIDWEYERERRIVVRESFLAENPTHLAIDVIVGVVFGLKVSKDNVLRVREAINSLGCTRPVAYSRMTGSADGFSLDRLPIPDIDGFVRSL